MKKGKIFFAAFMIISYALLAYGFFMDEKTLIKVSFACFTLSLVLYLIVSLTGSTKERSASFSKTDPSSDDAFAEGKDASGAQAMSGESAVERYVTEIRDLKIAMEDQRESYENQLSELEEKLSEEETEKNRYRSRLEELSANDSGEAIMQALGRKDLSYASILPQMTGDGSETVDIVAAAQSVVNELKRAAQKAGLIIQVSSSEEKILVKADPGLIRVLFRNIVDNSIKYMNRQGNLVITLSTIADDLFVVLKDNGEGLAESETEHIFELNYQGSNRISGNGLGLAQAKAVVEYYGGNIYAKSSAGGGMGIYIQLPTS